MEFEIVMGETRESLRNQCNSWPRDTRHVGGRVDIDREKAAGVTSKFLNNRHEPLSLRKFGDRQRQFRRFVRSTGRRRGRIIEINGINSKFGQ